MEEGIKKEISEKEEAEIIRDILDAHKVENIRIIDVSKISPFASYYVIATCINITSLDSIKDILEEDLVKYGLSISLAQGNANSGWIIIQVDNCICHLFLDVNRREIGLEDLLEKYIALMK